ncbi:MAG: biliverdin-producing heme oxygenase [Chloroflexota bacterium]|nr:biliverdin-producing heme oxygenase [Chloroflexota bacterium]
MERLRAETRDHHTRVEALPFFNALIAGELPLDSYVGLLRAMGIVHDALEHAFMQTTYPVLSTLWDNRMRRLQLIQRDLKYFENDALQDLPAATLSALSLEDQIRARAHQDPVSLLGYLYVLQDSVLGGIVLRSHVARAFSLRDAHGLAYLSSYEKGTQAQWKRFTERMNAAPVDVSEQDRVVEAACEAFEGIEQIVQVLYPIRSQAPRELVGALNREAGHHGIPNDVREIRAALRAGEQSWQRFPYYAWRFGPRGRRFTRSDSAWIVTLAEHRQEVVDQQIKWLGQLLSARGMPQWMLELHLEGLHDELVSAVPDKQQAYDKLLKAAQELRAIRRRHISDEAFQSLSSAFEAAVGAEWSNRLQGTGGLLVAAVADEKAGIKDAVASLESWMTEPSRFPSMWIEAVRMTLRKAREQSS